MSSTPKHNGNPGDSSEEETGGVIDLDPQLEAALREAVDAVESAAEAASSGDDPRGAEEAESLAEGEAPDTELRDEAAEAEDRLLRLQAEFDNFRKRALKERQEALQYGHQNLFKDLLSVVDNLDRAIGHARDSGGGDLESFLQGVELVRRELRAVFEKHHVSEIDALGKPFDPALHEAMAQVESGTAPPNTVVEVLEKGFQLRDRLVRPSRVIVTRAAETGEGGESGAND